MIELNRPILIVAGGTGGHIYPALAVAECLAESNIQAVWLGSEQGLETRIVPDAGIQLFKIAVTGLRGRSAWRWLISPFALSFAIVQAILVVLRTRPTLVLGMGGFASGPGGLAAWICRRPLVIHEQNSIPGLTNKLLSRLATKVLQGFPGAFPSARNAITVGNPVRRSIVSLQPPDDDDFTSGRFNILVIGGSRGADALNVGVPAALSQTKVIDAQVHHQVGIGKVAETRERYFGAQAIVEVSEFIESIDQAYRWASIVICRAGALTISEISAVGVASILVPFPYAADDHQTANAAYLVDAEAALLVAEGVDFETRLAAAMQSLFDDRAYIARLAARARQLAMPNAATIVAKHCRELIDA